MNQSSSIAAALLIGFIVFITLKNQLSAYIALIVGPSGPSGSTESVNVPSGSLSGTVPPVLTTQPNQGSPVTNVQCPSGTLYNGITGQCYPTNGPLGPTLPPLK